MDRGQNEKRYDAQPRVLPEEAAVMVEEAATAIKAIKLAPAHESRVASKVTIQVRTRGGQIPKPRLDRADRPGIEICCTAVIWLSSQSTIV